MVFYNKITVDAMVTYSYKWPKYNAYFFFYEAYTGFVML